MARTRVRFSSLLALSAALALVTGCGNGNGDTASKDGPPGHHGGKPVVVVTTTWEGPSPRPPEPRTSR